MKKAWIVLLIICLCLAGCGNGGKPDDVSEEMYDLAVYAIKVADLYLNGQCSIDETYEKLDNMSIPEFNFDTEYKRDNSVNIGISSLKTSALGIRIGSRSLSDFKKSRDELAEEINYKD